MTMKPTRIYDQFDIVKLPFPFTDKMAIKKRPALIISSPNYQLNNSHVILVMITSANHSAWKDDIKIRDLKLAGLSSPSVIRFKLFSLDEDLVINYLGRLSSDDTKSVSVVLEECFFAKAT